MKRLACALLLAPLAGCLSDSDSSQEGDLTSHTAVFLDLAFEGEVIAPRSDNPQQQRKAIVTQLFYLSGELDKAHGGHGRFGYARLENLTIEPGDDGLDRIRYDAVLPIALPKHRDVPESLRVVLPLRVDPAGLSAFNAKYAGKCGPTKYGAEALWYDFQPVETGCALDSADVVDTVAQVSPSENVTDNRRPEHERFWDDGVFRMVVVHGTDAASSFDPNDIGVREYVSFQERLKAAHPGGVESKGEAGYDIYDEWRFEAAVPAFGGGEGKLEVTMLLTGSLSYIGAEFDERYAELSAGADLVSFAGHSGLGKNIQALASRGTVTPGHYQVFFLDGCSTFAYLDDTLANRFIEANGEADPNGTKFLDLIVNAQPAPWYAGASNLWTVTSTLSDDEPHAYLDILEGISSSGMPLVAGEEDNPTME